MTVTPSICYGLSFLLAVVTTLVLSPSAAAASLDEELTRVVAIAMRALDGETEIRVDPFRDLTAGTKLSGSVRTGLTAAFEAECKRQGLTIVASAKQILEGRFTVTDEDALRAGEPLVLELQWGLIDRRGRQIVEIIPSRVEVDGDAAEHFALITDLDAVGKAAGLSGVVASDIPAADTLAKLALKPTGVAESSRIRSHSSSLFAVEVLSRRAGSGGDFEPITAVVEGGRPFVEIPEGHEYRLRIHNDSSESVAVATSIDGLSTFHFADESLRDPSGRLLHRHYIFAPQSSALVSGWHLRNSGANNVGRFLVTNYGDSAAGALGVPEGDDSGAIHLQFCKCRSQPRRVESAGLRTRGLGTKLGERETVPFNTSDLLPGDPIELLTIRYDR